MTKIDYSKAEGGMEDAVQKMRQKKLLEGKGVTSERASEFYNLETTPREIPEDAIERLLEEEAFESEQPQGSDLEEYEEFGTVVEGIPSSETVVKSRPRKGERKPQRAVVDATGSMSVPEKLSPLITLRKHILWLKTKGVKERYELLGTSKEEVFRFRQKEELAKEDFTRVELLNKKAEEMRAAILAKEATSSDESLIETQKKSQKTKKLSVRDRWLKL